MSATPEDRARYLAAKKHVAALRGVYIHASVFAVVMLALLGLNAWLGGVMWALWPLAGWGLGLAAHAAAVFGRMPKAVTAWEQRKVREVLKG